MARSVRGGGEVDAQSESLFDEAEEAVASAAAPLAVRMQPRTLDEVIGQQHLTSTGTPFRTLVDNDAPMSLLPWGPPGTGQAPLAYVVSQVTRRGSVELSAVRAGVEDVRAAVAGARRTMGLRGAPTRRPPTTWSGWPAATRGARSPTWKPPRSACPGAAASIPRCWSARWTGPRSATTGMATSTTT